MNDCDQTIALGDLRPAYWCCICKRPAEPGEIFATLKGSAHICPACEARLDEARALPIADVVDRLGLDRLKRSGGELVGPCPKCGGRDRFGVHVRDGVWNCRRCDQGGDGIGLVRHVLACDFAAALAWLVGEREVELDPEEARHRREATERRRRQSEERAREERARAIAEARRIWRDARAAEGSDVDLYLARRGLNLGSDVLWVLPRCLRFAPDRPYWRRVGDDAREWHRGPAMIAAVQGPDDRLCAVHQTWIDLDQPSGKARIVVAGEEQPAKLVCGSKKGGAIRLLTPPGAEVLVMGEGIETTLSAAIAEAVPGAAYWAGVDLGNMAGRRKLGEGLKYAGLPEMNDLDAFVPPAWVRRLIYIQDGDSDPRLTRAKLESGLRRAMLLRPGLVGQIVHAGEGVDLNDVLVGEPAPAPEGSA